MSTLRAPLGLIVSCLFALAPAFEADAFDQAQSGASLHGVEADSGRLMAEAGSGPVVQNRKDKATGWMSLGESPAEAESQNAITNAKPLNGAKLESVDGVKDSLEERLLECAARGDAEGVKEMLRRGADANCHTQSARESALTVASAAGSVSCVKELLSAGAKVNARSFADDTALIAASRNGHVACVKELLRHGADKDMKNVDGKSALDIAMDNRRSSVTALLQSEKASDSSTSVDSSAPSLCPSSPGPSGAGKNKGAQQSFGEALLVAAQNADAAGVRESLAKGAPADYRDERTGQTALVKACVKGSLSCVQSLIRAGADVNAKTHNDNTPLIAASRNGHLACVKELLKHGADKDMRNVEGKRALDIAKDNRRDPIVALLQPQSAPGSSSLAESSSPSLPPSSSDSGASGKNKGAGQSFGAALLAAAQSEDAAGVRDALSKGAPVDYRDARTGQTALVKACVKGSLPCVQALIGAGANVNAKTHNDNTPLIASSRNGHPACVKELLKHGADKDVRNVEGKSALDIAKDNKRDSVVALLENASGAGSAPRFGQGSASGPSSLGAGGSGKGDMQALGMSLLEAAQRGDLKGVQESLRQGAFVNHRDECGQTPLLLASGAGALSCVKELIGAGADVDAKAKDAETPLIVASRNGHASCVRELLAHGANRYAQNAEGKSAMDVASQDVLSVFSSSQSYSRSEKKTQTGRKLSSRYGKSKKSKEEPAALYQLRSATQEDGR